MKSLNFKLILLTLSISSLIDAGVIRQKPTSLQESSSFICYKDAGTTRICYSKATLSPVCLMSIRKSAVQNTYFKANVTQAFWDGNQWIVKSVNTCATVN